IIAATGLVGHAFGSWAHYEEQMWFRDYLPKDAPNARILTILQDHTNKFFHSLVAMREEGRVGFCCSCLKPSQAIYKCESRPIIFIGHSLGCLIIKKVRSSCG
ncbi:hypothetical protein BDZ45DRAFT_603627, partial [Acephala macrosclerotiorum]